MVALIKAHGVEAVGRRVTMPIPDELTQPWGVVDWRLAQIPGAVCFYRCGPDGQWDGETQTVLCVNASYSRRHDYQHIGDGQAILLMTPNGWVEDDRSPAYARELGQRVAARRRKRGAP
jgi:hypothetical protein